jgi:hypothetical protein
MPRPTIFAMGGGGFLSEPADAALERYVLDLAEPVEPRICFPPQPASTRSTGSCPRRGSAGSRCAGYPLARCAGSGTA